MDMPVHALEAQHLDMNIYGKETIIFARPVGDLGIGTSYSSPFIFYVPEESGGAGSQNSMQHEDSAGALPHYLLEEIVVVGEKADAVLEPVTTTSYSMSAPEIEMRKAASLDELLNTMVSVRASTGEKNETRIYLRGLSPANYIILLDGAPIVYSPYDRSLDFQQIPAAGIAKIVVSPNAPSLYGPNTMGGAINIITRKGDRKPFYSVTSEISDYSYRRINYSAGIERNGFNFSSSAEYRQSDGFKLSNGSRRGNADFKGKNISLKAGKTTDKLNVSLFSSFIRNNDKGLPVSLDPDIRARYWRFTYWDKDMAGVNAQYAVSERLSLKGRVFYEKFTNNLNAFMNNAFSDLDWSSTFDDDVYGGAVEGHVHGNSHDLAITASGRRDKHRDQGDSGEPWLQSRENVYSMAFYDVSRIRNLLINVGSSFDFQEVTEAESFTIKNDFLRTANPEFGIAYVGGSYKIRANVNKKTNFPSLQNLTSSRSANPDLNAEKAVKVEAGIDYARGVTISFAAFNNDMRDRIDRKSKNDPYENINKANIRGVELLVKGPLSLPLSLSAGYTYLDATDHLFGQSEREMPYVPDHNFRISAGKRFLKERFLVTMAIDIVSRLPYVDRSNKVRHLDGYQDADFSLHYRVTPFVEFYVKAINTFNQNIVEEAGFPRSGRRLFTGVTFGN